MNVAAESSSDVRKATPAAASEDAVDAQEGRGSREEDDLSHGDYDVETVERVYRYGIPMCFSLVSIMEHLSGPCRSCHIYGHLEQG